MKTFFIGIFLSLSSFATTHYSTQYPASYPIQIGIGGDTCYLNDQGLKVCAGFSPRAEEVNIEMISDSEALASYGYFTKSGTYQKIGFQVSVKVIHYDQDFHDDFITLSVVTWALNNPSEKHTVESEVFASKPNLLNRTNLIGHAIGTEDDYANIILGILPTGWK